MADDPDEKEGPTRALDEDDIALLKTYGLGPYATRIKAREKDLQDVAKRVNEISGLKESDTGLAPPSRWDLVSDKQAMQEEQPLQVLLPAGNIHTASWILQEQYSPRQVSKRLLHLMLHAGLANTFLSISPLVASNAAFCLKVSGRCKQTCRMLLLHPTLVLTNRKVAS